MLFQSRWRFVAAIMLFLFMTQCHPVGDESNISADTSGQTLPPDIDGDAQKDFLTAMTLKDSEDYEGALQLLEGLHDGNEQSITVNYEIGVILVRLERHREAEDY